MGSALWLLTMILLRQPGPTFRGSCSQKKFGGGGGALHRPLFDPARLGGTGKAGAGSCERGWAVRPIPPGSFHRRGRRLPAGRPELVYSAPAFKRARRLTASERNRE